METKSCPVCGGTLWIPIVYGLPGPDLVAAAERGEVALGGCMVETDQPDEVCARCNARATRPTLYVLTGLPGAGKSTHAAALAATTGARHVAMDDAVHAAGLSLVDYEARFALQPSIEASIPLLLAEGESVIAEFGSWGREERDRLRGLADGTGARTELHWADAPLEVCRERILARGGLGAEDLAGGILDSSRDLFDRPTPEEGAAYDAFVTVSSSTTF
jgi:predicted kinase